jgi:hypothetical protein
LLYLDSHLNALNVLLELTLLSFKLFVSFHLHDFKIKVVEEQSEMHLSIPFTFESVESFVSFFALSSQSIRLFNKSITLASRNIDLSLFRIDLGSPWLKFFLFNLDLVMENLCLI